ncbi:MAG: YggT family protein [Betaproteobacteria bacterium]|nr:YggT family protein [Betaproteobacteria bacterium]
MLIQPLIFVLETFAGLFVFALLMRFYLQWFRAAPRNPASLFLHALTDWIVLPARRLIPGLWGIDLASLVMAWAFELLLMILVASLQGVPISVLSGASWVGLALLAVVRLIKLTIYLVMFAVIVQAVLSWVNPYNPAAPILNSVTNPFLRHFRRRIPNVGGVDLSPLFVIVVCQLLLMVPIAWLERMLAL